jgi:hypothetical protein
VRHKVALVAIERPDGLKGPSAKRLTASRHPLFRSGVDTGRLTPPQVTPPQLTPSDEAGTGGFGDSVALSADGNTALIGGPGDNPTVIPNHPVGAAWVFTRSGSTWTQQGPKLTASDETGGGTFGTGVALSADGNRALIAAPGDGQNDEGNDGFLGAAWMFTRSGSTWTQLGPKLTASDQTDIDIGGGFGDSVALSADGTTALIGGPHEGLTSSDSLGAAWVFAFGTPHPTITAVKCKYIVAAARDTCTATVSDSSGPLAVRPGGGVQFSSGAGGVFSAASTCNLLLSPLSNVSSCSVQFIPPATGTPIITGHYLGDSSHVAPASSGHGTTVDGWLGTASGVAIAGLGHLAGSVFGGIGHAVLGALLRQTERDRRPRLRASRGRRGHSRMTATVTTLFDNASDEPAGSALPAPAGWPAAPGPAAYHGLLGEIVRQLEPETEADPVAILAQLLVCFGAAVGRGAYFQVEATRHYPQEFVLIVGESATARKGTSWDHARRLINTADATLAERILTGLSPGEGLVWAVRDPTATDPGIPDRRLVAFEAEFVSVAEGLHAR